MATWDDVSRLALALPETTESGRSWKVRDKTFAWERPLRPKDLEALGDAAPDGPILGVRTDGVGPKEMLLADSPHIYFTTPHFNGYPAVLLRLDEISADELGEILDDAWSAQAPKRLRASRAQEAPEAPRAPEAPGTPEARKAPAAPTAQEAPRRSRKAQP